MNNKLPSIKILGINITNASKADVLEYIMNKAKKKEEKMYIVTPNPEIIMYGLRHKEYEKVLNGAEIAIPDGAGTVMAGSILGYSLKERIPGVELLEDICRESSKNAVTVGFLGGRGGVAKRTAERLQQKYHNLRVNFIGEEWGNGENTKNNTPSPISDKQSSIDILFVAFGFPKQEEWIAKNLPLIPVTIAMGVGGSFDYLSGKVPRAPRTLRMLGFEWAFRLVNQPWRAGRQSVLPLFLLAVIKAKLTGRN